ncbi:hypothetical protein [Methylobacterium haplocladii]|uniref:Uncharacterized protein n=1 Tax=Methylobacterium haplocladii TaxID=1176176 RepID=A0A512IK07_9HYPH|nr:hypothetical protein [Methylobacterium haplocladii]GEO98021.1 hypothetical protein MHA02_04090 [Methylobacterium haplocladii]GJD86461.1 hypothetical protein HPGCJGGD_4368 [Methylobacterium haplocladii]GLS57922.1 hypothetical protein GCM10007887_05780 [Methylobacterium haplocladii]
MNPRTTLSKSRDTAAEPRPSALVVAMPQTAGRRFRREAPSEAASHGQILLFTGVRYERMPDMQAEPAIPQRKRS